MSISSKAIALTSEAQLEARLDVFNRVKNSAKISRYWVGFLEGILSSNEIEPGEEAALLAESEAVAAIYSDADVADLREDIETGCFASTDDLTRQLRDVVACKRSVLCSEVGSSELDELNEFLGFCAGVVCDGVVLPVEINAILSRLNDSYLLTDHVLLSELRMAVWRAAERVTPTDADIEGIQTCIADLVGDGHGVTGICNIGSVAGFPGQIVNAKEVRLNGSIFVLTGRMRMGSRAEVVSAIERAGGSCGASTTRRTDYIVVSSEASRHWICTHFGRKIERALELIDEGLKFRFVSEVALEAALKNSNV